MVNPCELLGVLLTSIFLMTFWVQVLHLPFQVQCWGVAASNSYMQACVSRELYCRVVSNALKLPPLPSFIAELTQTINDISCYRDTTVAFALFRDRGVRSPNLFLQSSVLDVITGWAVCPRKCFCLYKGHKFQLNGFLCARVRDGFS
jgi:hypothetical protein